MPEKILPHSLEAESGVLGAMLMDKAAATVAFDMLAAADFFNGSNSKIFSAMLELFNEGYSIDLISLCERLTRKNEMQAVGGLDYLSGIVQGVATSANIEHHARIVKEKSTLRQGVKVCGEYYKLFWSDGDPDKLISNLSTRIALLPSAKRQEGFVTMADESDRTVDHVEAVFKGTRPSDSIESGIEDFDNRTGGFYPGSYWVIASRPSIGKTALALAMAWNMTANPDSICAFASLEMNKRELMFRMIASQTGVPVNQIKQGSFSKDNLKAIIEAGERIKRRSNLFVDDTPDLEISRLRSRVIRLKEENPNLKIVFVDYLQILRSTLRTGSDYERVTHISQQLKTIPRESNTCLIALSQIRRNKDGETKEPTLDALKQSGAIEENADGVLLLHRATREDRVMKCIVAKQRQGPIGTFYLYYNLIAQTFAPHSDRTDGGAVEYDMDKATEGLGF